MTFATSKVTRPKKSAPKAAKWPIKRLVVVSMIAGLVAAAAGYSKISHDKSYLVEKAKVQIEQLSAAIEKYKLDNGDYPGLDPDSPLDGDISEELYNELFHDGYNDLEVNGGEGVIPIYLNELDPRNSKQTMVKKTNGNNPPSDLKILDPWGRPYLYRKGNLANNPDYDLWSAGEDGMTDAYDPSRNSKENRDDIRNF